MTDIRVASAKTIVKTPYLEFKEEKVQIGDLQETYHTLYRAAAALVFPLTDKYEVYLISQYRVMYGKRILEPVAGYIDAGEVPLHAAKRELQEEAGITATHWEELLRTELAASIIKGTIHIFLAKGLDFVDHNREPGEDIEVLKMPLSEAVGKIATGEIQNATVIAGLLYLDKLKREKKI